MDVTGMKATNSGEKVGMKEAPGAHFALPLVQHSNHTDTDRIPLVLHDENNES